MASVIYADKCPQCGGVCIVNSYYRKGQMSAFCERCGWSYYKDGDCEEETQGYGVAHVTYKGGITDIFGIHKPPNENEKVDFLKMLQTDDVDADKSYLTIWDEEKQQIISVFGSLPPAYDESVIEKE